MVKIPVGASHLVSGLLQVPVGAAACLVLAHGAGAGMTHSFMAAVADGLFARKIATLRYQFPAMESGRHRPDPPALAQATVRAAVAEASKLAPGLQLFAGGKSFGGRMTSLAQAVVPLPGVKGLFFLGFPLHRAKLPSTERAEHLAQVLVPMIFVQGSRDALAEMSLIRQTIDRLGPRATLLTVEEGDHSFHVPARSGRSDPEVLASIIDELVAWVQTL